LSSIKKREGFVQRIPGPLGDLYWSREQPDILVKKYKTRNMERTTEVMTLLHQARLIPLSQVHRLMTDRPRLRCARRPDEIRWLSCDGVAVA
jgi:hypothetical protein